MDLTAAYGFRMDWIVSFVAVARHGGFSAAGKAVFRGQSRISEHVAELERALGVQLFDRTAHPARLTPEGRALVPHAEEILRRLNDLASAGGEVRFGTYPSAAAWLFPQVAQRLPAEVRLHLVEGPSIELEGALGRGEVDLAIRPVHPLVASESLDHEVLWTEPLVAVFQQGHPLASAESVGLDQLANLPLISIGETSGGRQFESHLAFASAGLNPESVYRTNQPQTLLSLVRHGLGTGVTNALAVTTANLTGVRLVPIRDAGVERQVAIFVHRDRPRTPALEQVITAVQAVQPPTWP
ncbi:MULTISPECIES: LysR family transcriptional regulator [unclassified Kribbella]|uniref:LysR family transcriptional regulator n=1 Tax=unclassified Kribbella TaxID=2644121 RepID=UPI00340463FF|nr:LysR family transcriptional regulator [Kribbella sp. NBC_00889]